MQIEEGKFYRTRDGRKVGPAMHRAHSWYPWVCDLGNGIISTYTDGGYRIQGEVDSLDLVAEWVDAPEPGGAEELTGERSQRFSHDRWAALVEASYEQIKSLAQKKGGEYSGDDDRLANFRRNGAALGLPMETVWAVYAGKHWDAIQQFIKDQRNGKERERLEPIAGRVDDLLVYLLLFKAMLEESGHA